MDCYKSFFSEFWYICDRVFEEIDKLISDKVECELLGLKLLVNVHQVIIHRRIVIWSENIKI